ncbi:Serpin B4 [Araneus ventricosus]|uniref:Serpin B4 n=1 Tax=Araneus ventricosus TaxID=182803 RepID=A0A4Y2K4Q9_ARAVE|nr:Serpin B4 [Araneus ventricosus]
MERDLPASRPKLLCFLDSDEGASSLNIAEANNYLGLNLYKLLSEEKANVFFSPFSLSAAFAMLFYGAEKETAEEMRNVLGYKIANIKDKELKSSYQKLLDEVEKSPDSYTLTTANSVVSQSKFPVRKEYKSLLNDFFKAYLWEVDFAREIEKSIQLINEWVSAKTQKMIPKLLEDLDSGTVMVLLNAVYFKGFWLNQFSKEKTTLEKFNIRGEKKNYKKVEMMHIKERFPFSERESYKALQLPYKGGDISMLILLPNLANGLKDLESSLSYNFLQNLKQSMWITKVNVAIPKFKIDYSKSLIGAFQSLGVRKLFNSEAQLGGLSKIAGLCASDVIHQAVIEVNEEGSEAAAATAIPIAVRCLRPNITEEFIADHPFMFIIYNTKNNLIFFMGKVEEL